MSSKNAKRIKTRSPGSILFRLTSGKGIAQPIIAGFVFTLKYPDTKSLLFLANGGLLQNTREKMNDPLFV